MEGAARIARNAGLDVGVNFQLRCVGFLNLQFQLDGRHANQGGNLRRERHVLANRDGPGADVSREGRFDDRVVHGFPRDGCLSARASQRGLSVDHSLKTLARRI